MPLAASNLAAGWVAGRIASPGAAAAGSACYTEGNGPVRHPPHGASRVLDATEREYIWSHGTDCRHHRAATIWQDDALQCADARRRRYLRLPDEHGAGESRCG